MSPKDIKVGKTYRNRGKGTTWRAVVAIGKNCRPKEWWSDSPPPDEPGVEYIQNGRIGRLYLSSFARWAGEEVK